MRAFPWLVVATIALRGLWGGPTANLPWLHVVVALGTAMLAGAASRATLARGTDSARDVAFATGSAMLAGALVVHAVATPGALFGANTLVGITGLASIMLLAGAAFTAIALPPRVALRCGRRVALVAGAAVVVGFAGVGAVPRLLDLAPASVPPAMLALLMPAAAALLLVGAFARRWFDSTPAGSAPLEAGCTLLGASLLMHFGPAWTAAFWLSHAFELVGAALLAVGCARAFARAEAPAEPLIELHERPALRPEVDLDLDFGAAA